MVVEVSVPEMDGRQMALDKSQYSFLAHNLFWSYTVETNCPAMKYQGCVCVTSTAIMNWVFSDPPHHKFWYNQDHPISFGVDMA